MQGSAPCLVCVPHAPPGSVVGCVGWGWLRLVPRGTETAPGRRSVITCAQCMCLRSMHNTLVTITRPSTPATATRPASIHHPFYSLYMLGLLKLLIPSISSYLLNICHFVVGASRGYPARPHLRDAPTKSATAGTMVEHQCSKLCWESCRGHLAAAARACPAQQGSMGDESLACSARCQHSSTWRAEAVSVCSVV